MANNGQNMASLNANSMFYNMTTAVAMLAGRFGLAAFALALAGRFAAQRQWPVTKGSLRSDSATFGVLVLGTILLVGRCHSCLPLRSARLLRRCSAERAFHDTGRL
jgi:K+-transporting ATPase ATPase A chain